MTPKDWIKRWLKEHPDYNQTQLAEEAGIKPAKISLLLNGKNSGTTTYMVPLSHVMNISLDSIYDPNAKWPGKPLDGQGVRLSAHEQEVIDLAHRVSRNDSDPERLTTALDRLLGLKPAPHASLDAS